MDYKMERTSPALAVKSPYTKTSHESNLFNTSLPKSTNHNYIAMKISLASVWLFATLAQCAPRMSFGDGGVALKELESRQFHSTPGAAAVPAAYVSHSKRMSPSRGVGWC